MSYAVLLEKGQKLLEADNPRDALAYLKQAAKLQANHESQLWLFKAYLARERQLRLKGMDSEAGVVQQQAIEVCPPLESLPESEYQLYFRHARGTQAFKAYAGFLKTKSASRDIEDILVGRLLAENLWSELQWLPEDAPLRKDAGPVQAALPAMQAGDWEAALKDLQPVSRSSPYSPVRLFCRGMVAFYQNNDAEAIQALSMIAPHFPLAPLARKLQALLAAPETERAPLYADVADLFEVTPQLASDLDSFFKGIRNYLPVKQFQQVIDRIADAVYPRNRTAVTLYLLEVFVLAALQHSRQNESFRNYVNYCLSGDERQWIVNKCKWLEGRDLLPETSAYLRQLAVEFPDRTEFAMAKAQVLLRTAQLITRHPNLIQRTSAFVLEGLGLKSKDYQNIGIGLLLLAARSDPLHRDIYEALAELPRLTRNDRNLVEEGLKLMQQHFPKDPYACLKLAEVHYEKNAYRKAETILNQALKLAPHDRRVLEQHTAALLFSASRNLVSGNLAIAGKDILKAEAYDSSTALPYIVVLKLLLEGQEKQQNLVSVLHEMTLHLDLFYRLRIYGLLFLMIENRPKLLKQQSVFKDFKLGFHQDLKEIATLSSQELARLLAPLDKFFARAFYGSQVAHIFLNAAGETILNPLSNEDLTALYPNILTSSTAPRLLKELRQRLKPSKEKHNPALRFLELAIDVIYNKKCDPKLFEKLTDKLPSGQLEELKELSRRLASLTGDPILREVFNRFEFNLLYRWRFNHGKPSLEDLSDILNVIFDDHDWDDDDDDDWDDEEDWEEEQTDFEDALLPLLEKVSHYGQNPLLLDIGKSAPIRQELAQDLLAFLNRLELEGLPAKEIKKVRDELLFPPFMKEFMRELKKIFTPRRFPDLPEYARVFLHG